MATPPYTTRPSHIPCSQQAGRSPTPPGLTASRHREKTMAQLADIKANEVLLACAIGDLSWLKRGISSGSNPGAANREGLNGLHLSAKNGHFDCLKYLVNNSGLDINTLSEQSKAPPLHYSVQVKNGTKMYQCMKLLLDRGADYGIKDIHGQSVLHFAAKSGNIKCLKLLLDCGVSIHDKDHNGKTAYDIACLSNNYESARLLRAMHWAHKKDVLQNNKMRSEQLLQRRETAHKASQARLSLKRGKTAYNNWLEKKHFSNTLEPPQECERRKESIASPYIHSTVCGTCSKQSRIPVEDDRRTSMPIKVNYHQEERNLESVGKPDRLQPYTNVAPKSAKVHKDAGRSGSIVSSASASGRGSRATSMPAGVKFYTRRVRLGVKLGDGNRKKSKVSAETPRTTLGDIETVVSSVPEPALVISTPQQEAFNRRNHIATIEDAPDSDKQSDDSGTESDELDFSKLNEVELAYPQYDFDVEDDTSLFHDVGDFNDLDSLSLPTAMTKDRTPAEILQLLRKLGGPGSSGGKRIYRRSNSYSYSSKQASRPVGRRLSLGSIPEGKIVTDYKEEEEEEDNDIDSQFFRNLENTIKGIGSSDEEGRESRSRSPSPLGEPRSGRSSSDEDSSADAHSLSPSPTASDDETGTHEEEISTTAAAPDKPPKTLKILNFAWDPSSNLVHTEVSSTPITTLERKLPLKTLVMQPNASQPPQSLPTLEVTPPASQPTHHAPSENAPSITQKIVQEVIRARKITPPAHKITPLHEVMPPSYHEQNTSGDPSPQEVAPPLNNDTVVMLRKITPPSRKITPPARRPTPSPPRKVTPPSRFSLARKITPPSHEVSPLFHVTSHDSGESLSSLSLSPEVGGATTPPLNSPLHQLPFHLSLSEPCVAPGQRHSEEFYTDTAPANFSTPLFYLEESEEVEEAHDFGTTSQHSLFALSKSPMSKSMVLSSTDSSMKKEEERLGIHSASAPVMVANQSLHMNYPSAFFRTTNSVSNDLQTDSTEQGDVQLPFLNNGEHD